MKFSHYIKFVALLSAILLNSCVESDNSIDITPNNTAPTAQEMQALFQSNLNDKIQTFTFNTTDNVVSLTSANGVIISFNASCLTLNGNPVTGAVELEYVELFDKGDMLTTNKPTMGVMTNNDKNLLISGGEFYIQAKQNGADLETNCGINLQVPASLTGGGNAGMTLWSGTIDANEDLTWEELDNATGQENGVGLDGGAYYCYFGDFGWTNVDIFYSDPRPKTTIFVDVPDGYDDENSRVFLSYDGNGNNNLAMLDTYDDITGYFSEHYGQIPIGLECHVIFASENNGDFIYAIKGSG